MEREGRDATTPPAAAARVFGEQTELASRFVKLLRVHGVERGLIGPRELDRLWERHILNSAVIEELIPHGASVVDVGSGAGLPGVPLAIARPDLDIVLVEPMARRADWLAEATEELDLRVTVVRGRAEEDVVRKRLAPADIVTARALAPLDRLARWCLPLARVGGTVVAVKGATAGEEMERTRTTIAKARGGDPRLVRCGAGVMATPTTAVLIERRSGSGEAGSRRPGGRRKKGRSSG